MFVCSASVASLIRASEVCLDKSRPGLLLLSDCLVAESEFGLSFIEVVVQVSVACLSRNLIDPVLRPAIVASCFRFCQ